MSEIDRAAAMTALMGHVRAFHEACDVPVRPTPECPSPQRVQLRRDILREEWDETDQAMRRGDMLEIADGLADLIYVAIGTALEYGIPLDRVWAEVQRSNMAKRCPTTGKVRHRADGKVLKPEGWTPPDIAKALFSSPVPAGSAG